jgi:hypothetical protein
MAPQICTPDEAAALVRTTDTIGFGLGPANPDAFLTALGDRHDWVDLTVGGALLLGYYTVLAHPNVSYRCGFCWPAEPISSWYRADSDNSLPFSVAMTRA